MADIFDTSIYKPTFAKPASSVINRPHANVDDLTDLVRETIKAWDNPSPLVIAQNLHKHLVLCGHRSDEENILYDFDEHYKLKFIIGETPYYFETWRTWQGALNWVITEDLA